MVEPKTKKTGASVAAFLDAVEGAQRREDAKAVARMMEEVTGEEPAMWGDAIVGFGERPMRYASGRELDWPTVGFSPRKANLSLYIPGGLERLGPLLDRLGKHKTGGGCLYIKRLSDVDEGVLREIVEASLASVEAP